jgi:hypothetical protein
LISLVQERLLRGCMRVANRAGSTPHPFEGVGSGWRGWLSGGMEAGCLAGSLLYVPRLMRGFYLCRGPQNLPAGRAPATGGPGSQCQPVCLTQARMSHPARDGRGPKGGQGSRSRLRRCGSDPAGAVRNFFSQACNVNIRRNFTCDRENLSQDENFVPKITCGIIPKGV